MEKDSCNKQQKNQISIPPLIMLMLIGIFLTLLINSAHTLVYAQKDINKDIGDIKGVVFNVDSKKERISNGIKLITVKRGNDTKNILTTLTDPKEILNKSDVVVEPNDSIYLNTEYLIDGSILMVVRTEVMYTERVVDIPYETEVIKNSKYFRGDKVTVQEGVLGIKTERVLNFYEDGVLVKTELIEEEVNREPVPEIVEIGTSWYSLEGIDRKGYNCPYWYKVVESGPYNEEEKQWLKFIMECESGCNAESNKNPSYKGLFQWSPYWWRKQFDENIFDGHAQIKHTVAKYRSGESTRANLWPACHKQYRSEFPL